MGWRLELGPCPAARALELPSAAGALPPLGGAPGDAARNELLLLGAAGFAAGGSGAGGGIVALLAAAAAPRSQRTGGTADRAVIAMSLSSFAFVSSSRVLSSAMAFSRAFLLAAFDASTSAVLALTRAAIRSSRAPPVLGAPRAASSRLGLLGAPLLSSPGATFGDVPQQQQAHDKKR